MIEIIDVGGSPESKEGGDKREDKQENGECQRVKIIDVGRSPKSKEGELHKSNVWVVISRRVGVSYTCQSGSFVLYCCHSSDL